MATKNKTTSNNNNTTKKDNITSDETKTPGAPRINHTNLKTGLTFNVNTIKNKLISYYKSQGNLMLGIPEQLLVKIIPLAMVICF